MKLARILAGLALAAIAASAAAQYPNKPIKLIVPFPAGSATDTISRILGNSVSQSIGQTIVVENKAGADGAIAGAEVAKAPPDGYTLLMATNSPMAVAPAMKKVPPYDPVNDFTPITDIGRYTFFLFAYAGLPQKTLAELIAYAKANPGKLAYATGNTTGIVSFAQFSSLAGIQMLHVPYKGEPAAITDLIAGRVQLIFATPTTGLAHVKDGKLRDRDFPQAALADPSRCPHNRGGRTAEILDPVLGRALWPGQDAQGRHRPAQQGIPRRDEAAGRSRGNGQAGVHPHAFDTRGTRHLYQGAEGGIPGHPARGRRATRMIGAA